MNDARTSHVRWFLVGWMFILSAVSYLDRANISVAGVHRRGIRAEQCAVGLCVQRDADWLCPLSDRGWKTRRPLRTSPRADGGSRVVGDLHRIDRPGAVHHPRGAVSVHRDSLSAGCRRGSGVSLVEPICGAMDSGARARHRQRLDFCRRRRGRRPVTAVDYLLHAALRLEIVLLGMCHHRLDRGRGLVSHGSRRACGASACIRL